MTCIHHTFHTCVNADMLPLKVCVFSERKKGPTPMKTGRPIDPASQNTSVKLSSKFCTQNNCKAAN